MTRGAWGIPDDEFWRDLASHRAAAIARAAAEGFLGYALDAPQIVDIGSHDTLPVAILRRVSAAESADDDIAHNALLVAVRRVTSEVFVGRAFDAKYTPPTRALRAPPPPTVVLADAFLFELRERIPSLPWTPGSYALYLLVKERATDPVVVRLVATAGASLYPAPALDAPWPPVGARPLPRYTRADTSPAIPRTEGVSLVCDPVVILQPEVWCVLEGSFHLRVDLSDDEDEATWSDDEATTRQTLIDLDAHSREREALTPLTLVLTGDRVDEAWHCTLSLPATLSGGVAKGYFSVDLFALPNFPRAPGNYTLWAFAGDVIAGPEPIALILEERLAPP